MKTNFNGLRTILAGALFASLAFLPASSLAQSRHGHGGHGGGHGGSFHGSFHGGARGGGYHGGGTFRSGGSFHGDWSGGHTFARPDRFSGVRGFDHGFHGYRPEEWRHIHPNWNGHYYIRGGIRYYDPLFEYPVIVDNDWDSIAAISGGVALLGALDDDPTLFFAGTVGALYSLSRYDDDRYSDDPVLRLRASYFSRPFFWRHGVRYDRVIVHRGGHEYYRFVRH